MLCLVTRIKNALKPSHSKSPNHPEIELISNPDFLIYNIKVDSVH